MPDDYYRAARERMVAEQLAARAITDTRVLDAMRRVPRERFVPADQAAYAYEDRPLPLPHGQTISQPLMVALMLQFARLSGAERVLDVGTGSGYQAALLADLCGEVITVERIPALADSARAVLRNLGYGCVQVVTTDGSVGYPPNAPYDRIIVAAGAPDVPESLVQQLAPNGLLIIPVGGEGEQSLFIISKDEHGRASRRDEGWCAFVPLIGAAAWPDADAATRTEPAGDP